MELEDFKSDYLQSGKLEKDKDALQRMLHAGNPVIKGIRRQLIVESILWIFFLVVYYDFFDGHLKPLIWNLLLILSVMLLLMHSLLGYKIINNPVNGNNIQKSIKNYLQRVRRYSIISIASRIMAIIIVFGYFLSSIESNEKRLLGIGFLLLLVTIQGLMLRKIWLGRIDKIKKVYTQLTA
jgi:signal transduction histidine kinase